MASTLLNPKLSAQFCLTWPLSRVDRVDPHLFWQHFLSWPLRHHSFLVFLLPYRPLLSRGLLLHFVSIDHPGLRPQILWFLSSTWLTPLAISLDLMASCANTSHVYTSSWNLSLNSRLIANHLFCVCLCICTFTCLKVNSRPFLQVHFPFVYQWRTTSFLQVQAASLTPLFPSVLSLTLQEITISGLPTISLLPC